jgi:hypothetical protein
MGDFQAGGMQVQPFASLAVKMVSSNGASQRLSQVYPQLVAPATQGAEYSQGSV